MSDVLVLCYHAVSEDWDAALSVTPGAFEAQMGALVGRGWHGANFTEAVLDPPYRRTLVVTFDDGYLSVLELAKPILDRLELPATVFVPTAFMERRQPLLWPGVDRWLDSPFRDELEGMCWDDLRKLTELGWEIGSHTRTHPRLTQLDDEAAGEEIERSRRDCERELGISCTSLAYPYGAADQRIADAAGSAGYVAAAVLSSGLFPRGPLLWPRVGVYHRDGSLRFRLKANGAIRRLRASRLWPADG
jgi:peptidoglycan/xylan/chitin deacetylase (PgdA/CDA1 family)